MLKKRNLTFLCLLILGVLLITSCLPKPPVTEGVLKGQVIVPEGTLQAKDATTTTDADGNYQVFVPEGGPYILQAIKGGVKVQQITSQVEVGVEYDLGTANCSTTSVALIAQAMVNAEDYPNDLVDINLTDIETDPDFNDVMNPVCSTIEAGGDPTELAVIQQAVEDFLYPPAPTPPPPTPTYTVTFNSQGGSAVASQTVDYGGKVTKPTDPTREGYAFGGWYKEYGCTNTWDFNTDTVISDVTLYAKWTANNYTVTFNKDDDDAIGSMTAQTIACGSSANLTACAFTKAGYTFAGWATSSGGSVAYADEASYTIGTSNVTLYAQWKNSAKEITTYKFEAAENTALSSDVTGTVDSGAHTVVLTVPYGTTITALKATFALSASATTKVGSTVQVSGTTANDFTNPVTYTVTAEDSSTQDWVVTAGIAMGPLDHFTITGYPTSVTAGEHFGSNNIVITAYDGNNKIKTDYTGKVYFTSTDGNAIVPYTSGSKYTFTAGDEGTHTFPGTGFTLKTTGSKTITLTEGTVSVTSNDITVNPAAANYFKVTGDASMTAGGENTITITAYDQYDNVATGYDGDKTLTFSGAASSSNPVTSPTCSNKNSSDINFASDTVITFTDGVGTSTLKLYKAETAHVKATQGAIATSDANDLDVTVGAGTKSKLLWDTQPPSSVASGATWTAFSIEITDAYGNRTSDTDNLTVTPSASSLGGTTTKNASAGLATFTDITCSTAGAITITGSATGLTSTPKSDEVTVNKIPLTDISDITGTPKVGETLTAGTLSPAGANVTYQWKICATSDGDYTNISGATSSTYTPVAGDVTKFIKVTATGTGNYTGTVTSAATTATAAAVINIAAIPGVTAPATGVTPVTTITETAQYTGTVTWDPADDPFLGSKVYTATITLTPETGFTLIGVTADFFTVEGASATNTINSGVVEAVFPATEAAVITDSTISGVTAPETGDNPVTEITATDQYTGTVTWSPNDSTFGGTTVYTATITLTAKTGFTLIGVAENFFTVAGATTDTNPADSGVVTAVFPETAAVIDIAAIPGVTAPVTGGVPVTEIDPTDQYTGAVTWSPTDDPFLGEKIYTATITLTAKTGYTLTGVTADFFTVAGVTTPTNDIDSGVVTAAFPVTLVIGAAYQGGKIAYILQSDDPGYDASVQHGLIAATVDQSTGIAWITGGDTQTTWVNGSGYGGTSTDYGTGQANTIAMMAQTEYTGGAAKVCDDYSVTVSSTTYSDWYLPSLDELNKLYINKGDIGGFTDDGYWSSSEDGVVAGGALRQIFSTGFKSYDLKSKTYRVRAVRAF